MFCSPNHQSRGRCCRLRSPSDPLSKDSNALNTDTGIRRSFQISPWVLQMIFGKFAVRHTGRRPECNATRSTGPPALTHFLPQKPSPPDLTCPHSFKPPSKPTESVGFSSHMMQIPISRLLQKTRRNTRLGTRREGISHWKGKVAEMGVFNPRRQDG